MLLLVLSLLVAGALGVFLLPDARDHGGAAGARGRIARLARHVRSSLESERELPLTTGSPDGMVRAAECLAAGRFSEARVLYELAARGVHSENPLLLLGLARSQFELADFAATLRTLDLLRQSNPGLDLPPADALRAQALAKLAGAAGDAPDVHLNAA